MKKKRKVFARSADMWKGAKKRAAVWGGIDSEYLVNQKRIERNVCQRHSTQDEGVKPSCVSLLLS